MTDPKAPIQFNFNISPSQTPSQTPSGPQSPQPQSPQIPLTLKETIAFISEASSSYRRAKSKWQTILNSLEVLP